MIAINPAATAQLEQMERELLDAIYEQGKGENVKITELSRKLASIPKSDARGQEILDEIKELTGGSMESLVDWAIDDLKRADRVKKAREAYLLARNILTGAGVL